MERRQEGGDPDGAERPLERWRDGADGQTQSEEAAAGQDLWRWAGQSYCPSPTLSSSSPLLLLFSSNSLLLSSSSPLLRLSSSPLLLFSFYFPPLLLLISSHSLLLFSPCSLFLFSPLLFSSSPLYSSPHLPSPVLLSTPSYLCLFFLSSSSPLLFFPSSTLFYCSYLLLIVSSSPVLLFSSSSLRQQRWLLPPSRFNILSLAPAAFSIFRPGNALLAPGGDLHKSTGAPKRSTGRF